MPDDSCVTKSGIKRRVKKMQVFFIGPCSRKIRLYQNNDGLLPSGKIREVKNTFTDILIRFKI